MDQEIVRYQQDRAIMRPNPWCTGEPDPTTYLNTTWVCTCGVLRWTIEKPGDVILHDRQYHGEQPYIELDENENEVPETHERKEKKPTSWDHEDAWWKEGMTYKETPYIPAKREHRPRRITRPLRPL